MGSINDEEWKWETCMIVKKLKLLGWHLMKRSVRTALKISFWGYPQSKEAISPDQSLIEKILTVEVPIEKKELESFLWLVSIYGPYVEGYSISMKNFADLSEK